jgi:hypothetical protein
MFGAIGVVLGFFAFAVGIEIYRRRRDRRLRLEAEWRALRTVAAERELAGEELRLLEAMVARHMGEHPYRAVTQRHAFEECIEKEMASLDDAAEYQRRGVRLRDVRLKLGMDFAPLGQRIQSTRELYLQQQVWVSTTQGDTDWHRMIVGMVDEGFFHLSPVGGEPLPAYAPGTTLRFRMWREEDARYLFSAVLEQVQRGPAAFLVRHTNALNRRQSRSHYRLRFEEATDVVLLAAPRGAESVDVGERPVVGTLRGRFSSLSGGGFAVVVNQPVPTQVLLRVTLALEGQEAFPVTGRIVGETPLMGGRHLLRAAFLQLDDAMRDKITHHVFQAQQRAMAAPQAGGAES